MKRKGPRKYVTTRHIQMCTTCNLTTSEMTKMMSEGYIQYVYKYL